MEKNDYYKEYFENQRVTTGRLAGKDALIVDYLRRHKSRIEALLDIGCLSSPLPEAIKASVEVVKYFGIDLIPEEKAGARERGIIYSQVDVDRGIPSGNVRFDVIVCSEVIEHLFSPDNIFNFSKNSLKDDGVLIVTTPNLAVWYNRILLMLGYQPCFSEVSVRHNVGKFWTNSRTATGGHLRMFTLKALVELARCYGLRTVAKASTGGGPGIVGIVTSLLSVVPSMGCNLFCVFMRPHN